MNVNEPKDSTLYEDHHPKGPNFRLIVILALVVLLVGLIAAYFLLSVDGRKLLPHGKNPQPNSLSRPYLAPSVSIRGV